LNVSRTEPRAGRVSAMSQNAVEAARDVSSFLVPHQSSEDLVAQGVPAREARRRAFRRTMMMEVVRTLIEIIFYWGVIMPALVTLILLVVIFCTRLADAFDGKNATGYVNYAVFGHIGDHCDMPIGWMVLLFWLVTFCKMFSMYAWERCILRCTERNCCQNDRCERVRWFLWYFVAVPLALWELIWPLTTFLMLVIARDCSWKLKASGWLVLTPYLMLVFVICVWLLWLLCLKPMLCRAGIIPDPANLVRSFRQVRYDPQAFNDDGGYATSCAICLSDFEAADQIVVAPCTHGNHVFHRNCLASWFRTAQTCPLCRAQLGTAAPERELEAPLDS